MDTWKISVLKDPAPDYTVGCMGPVRWDFPFPVAAALLPKKTKTALWVLTR
jgi:hypothetical protein